ncbi:hypothetical protein A1O3_09991 [Capronia epimyces CBS 606.96]|uniref:Uncharacterized protein n=1 Tax=Capronia epimyces CBS 606.96 TaxID=1182542 RepID=W9XB99_9EURO|nr:uncharacterized protein A1O3_09991 [Capronia epimyces CBS 606.96]EXJ77762.1 hypothetical protein A1O3_09991 [Capronia epimyces CBS 606.96]
MDMRPEDTELHEFNELGLHNATIASHDATDSANAVARYASTLSLRLHQLRRHPLGNFLYWIMLILGLLLLTATVAVMLFLTVSIWIHTLGLLKTHVSNVPLPVQT